MLMHANSRTRRLQQTDRPTRSIGVCLKHVSAVRKLPKWGKFGLAAYVLGLKSFQGLCLWTPVAEPYGRPQAWARGVTCPLWKCYELFCALAVTAKRSVDELLMHYFHNLSSAFGAKPPVFDRGSTPGPRWGTFVPRPLLCQHLEKNPEIIVNC